MADVKGTHIYILIGHLCVWQQQSDLRKCGCKAKIQVAFVAMAVSDETRSLELHSKKVSPLNKITGFPAPSVCEICLFSKEGPLLSRIQKYSLVHST